MVCLVLEAYKIYYTTRVRAATTVASYAAAARTCTYQRAAEGNEIQRLHTTSVFHHRPVTCAPRARASAYYVRTHAIFYLCFQSVERGVGGVDTGGGGDGPNCFISHVRVCVSDHLVRIRALQLRIFHRGTIIHARKPENVGTYTRHCKHGIKFAFLPERRCTRVSLIQLRSIVYERFFRSARF